jgi:hypothetical protein
MGMGWLKEQFELLMLVSSSWRKVVSDCCTISIASGYESGSSSARLLQGDGASTDVFSFFCKEDGLCSEEERCISSEIQFSIAMLAVIIVATVREMMRFDGTVALISVSIEMNRLRFSCQALGSWAFMYNIYLSIPRFGIKQLSDSEMFWESCLLNRSKLESISSEDVFLP